MSHEKKNGLTFQYTGLFNRDPYFMVYEIIAVLAVYYIH